MQDQNYNIPVFVNSSDSYSDIWDLFFDMFHHFWPEFSGTIYLQTENKEYERDDLNIISTRVGRQRAFGETLKAGLDKIPSDYVLFFMIDYMLMDYVDVKRLEIYSDYFLSNKLPALYLVNQNLPCETCADNSDICKYLPSEHMFSYQISFWNKKFLKEMALPHENPWTSEWYGNIRAIKAGLDIRAINNRKNDIFIYNHAGCLHRGKWLPDAVEFLKINDYSIDFSKRGYYQNEYRSLKVRLKLKLTFIFHGLLGSYWKKITV